MKRIIVSVLASLWVGTAFSMVPPEFVEVHGSIQGWFVTERVLLVEGKRYRLANEVEIVDGNGKVLDTSVLERGVSVLLVESAGEVQVVTINPRVTASTARPTR